MLSARAVFGPGQIETPSGIVSGVSEISFVLGWPGCRSCNFTRFLLRRVRPMCSGMA